MCMPIFLSIQMFFSVVHSLEKQLCGSDQTVLCCLASKEMLISYLSMKLQNIVVKLDAFVLLKLLKRLFIHFFVSFRTLS